MRSDETASNKDGLQTTVHSTKSNNTTRNSSRARRQPGFHKVGPQHGPHFSETKTPRPRRSCFSPPPSFKPFLLLSAHAFFLHSDSLLLYHPSFGHVLDFLCPCSLARLMKISQSCSTCCPLVLLLWTIFLVPFKALPPLIVLKSFLLQDNLCFVVYVRACSEAVFQVSTFLCLL